MANYVVGQEVGYARWHRGMHMMGHGFSTVTKINGHGHIILADGKKFDKRGQEYGATPHFGLCLMAPDYIGKELAAFAKQHRRNEVRKKVEQVMHDHRFGNGNMGPLPIAAKEELITLIKQL